MSVAIASREKVFAVCDDLWSKGDVPSVRSVRALLGGGNFATITKLIKEWKQQNQVEAVDTPIQVPAEVQEAFIRAYAVAVQTAQTSEDSDRVRLLEDEVSALRQQLAESEIKQDTLRQIMTALNSESVDELRRQLAESESRVIELELQASDDRETLHWQETKIRDLDTTCKELREKTAELQVKAKTADTLARELAEERKTSEERLRRVRELEGELKQATDRIQVQPDPGTTQAVHQLRKENADLVQRVEALKQELYLASLAQVPTTPIAPSDQAPAVTPKRRGRPKKSEP